MASSGATPAASPLALRRARERDDELAIAESVAFPELVWAHFVRQRELHEGGELHGPAEEEYRSQLERFVREHGRILNAYWCTSEASAVAVTEKRGERVWGFLWRRAPNIRFHAATDWATRDAPDLGHAMHTAETLAIRVSEVLNGTSERIAMQWLLSISGYLLSVVDRERGKPRGADTSKAANRARAELVKVEKYYDRAGEKTGRLIYFWGMMIGVAALALMAVPGAWVYSLFADFELKDPGTKTFFVCYGMGAVGAIISVLQRMAARGSDAFVDYEVGRPALRRVGSFRPVIGAVFAVVLYFALQSGLLQLQTGDAGTTTYFYAALAFIAGFSERKAMVLLGGATKILPEHDDATEQKGRRSDNAAERSVA